MLLRLYNILTYPVRDNRRYEGDGFSVEIGNLCTDIVNGDSMRHEVGAAPRAAKCEDEEDPAVPICQDPADCRFPVEW